MPTPYHTLELPSGRLEGTWDLTGRFDDYTGHVHLDGKTVLDVGTAAGFLTWEAEQRGATVTSFDISSADVTDELPIRGTDYTERNAAWLARVTRHIHEMRETYWQAHTELGSNARCVYGNVYDLTPAAGTFDVVLVGQILIHLRDGIAALTACASVCADTIVITEGSFPSDHPVAALAGRAALPDLSYAWYQYSHGWYREVLAMLGFRVEAISTNVYRCNHPDHEQAVELSTVVARRCQPTPTPGCATAASAIAASLDGNQSDTTP